jgi:uncharacterized membrane protein
MYVYFLCGPKQVMEKGRGKDNDRIAVPELVIEIYLKIFRPIARDGAGNIEVMIRLQKHLIACMLSIILR